jgi:hypothetical protein
MFTPQLKVEIAEKIQNILQNTNHGELPKGEIKFILHVDGEEDWSWANIRNNNAENYELPEELEFLDQWLGLI